MKHAVKKITLLIDLTKMGAFVPVPTEPGEARDAALSHNAQVALWRKVEGAKLAQQARALSFKVHIGSHGVLLRGARAACDGIELPKNADWREASERWTPFH